MTKKREHKQELLPRDGSECDEQGRDQEETARNAIARWHRSVKTYIDETPWGIRRMTEKIAAHGELYRTTHSTLEALYRLQRVEETLKSEDEVLKQEAAARARAEMQAVLDHELQTLQKELEIDRLKRAKNRVDDEDRLEKARLEEDINLVTKRREQEARKQKDTGNPAVRRIREKLRAEREMLQAVELERAKLFAEIDADVAAKKLQSHEAEKMKERIQEMINEQILEP